MSIPYSRLGEDVYKIGNAPVDVQEEISREEQILLFCYEPKSVLEIAEYLGYKDKRNVRKTINPLIEQGRLAMTIPEKPTSKLQKYIAIK